jgi:pimeloyl-ACP methyl ester carboxylesterase
MRRFDRFWILHHWIVALYGRRFLRVKGYCSIALPEVERSSYSDGIEGCSMPKVQFAAHPTTCTKIVVIYPGLGGTIDGECRDLTSASPHRYRRLAERLQSGSVAAVIRVANPPCGYYGGGQVALDRLRRAIEYALRYARALCGETRPELYLMGFSAGAGAAAALSGEYQPSRLLLVAPAWDVGPQRIIAGLKEYAGRLTILVGEEDEIVGRNAACLFDEISPVARNKKVLLVRECDHFFLREDHDRFLEETSIRVFTDPEL